MDYKRIKGEAERQRAYKGKGWGASAAMLRGLVDGFVEYLEWPQGPKGDRWALTADATHLPDQEWYSLSGEQASCQVEFYLAGAQINMTLVVRPTERPRMWKVQFFSKDATIEVYNDVSLAEFFEQASRELRRQFLETIAGQDG